ncbi:MAG: DUF2764 domain-containing protein [Spirochaetales bacterium]|nr:DUF2764 domain-containing protein [Spirochaetales bacterium]
MGNYYYAVSSLPFLVFDVEPVITMLEFNDICNSAVSSADMKIIDSVVLSETDRADVDIPLLAEWRAWEGSLRNELAKLRGSDMEVLYDSWLRDIEINTGAPLVARNAFKAESPLLAENVIDRGRWSFLDEIEVGHYFDIEKILVYSLRLQILERKQMFTSHRGEANFNVIYENIKEAVREA